MGDSFIFSLIIPFSDIIADRAPLIEIITARINHIFSSILIFGFPIVFRLIFGRLPIEALRKARLEKRNGDEGLQSFDVDTKVNLMRSEFTTSEMAELSPIEMLAFFSVCSRELSKSIFARAGVYLIVGVFVAFSGLAFFYSQTASGLFVEGWEAVVELVPKFGILLFIETIAFFFLRQYRAAMDEFRYYEAIKRNREETLALFAIASMGGKEVDVIELAKGLPFYSASTPLQKDQTTEILEGRKLEKNGLEILEKIIEAVSLKKK